MASLRWQRRLLRLGMGVSALIMASTQAASGRPMAPAVALNRPADPVVLTGADLPALVGRAPAQIVGWRYSGGWQQIPVQVDERAVVDWGQMYHYGQPIGVAALVYTDAATWTGADPDASFDGNDELALMAADSGAAAPAGSVPPGVVAASGVQLTITDPLVAGSAGYAYLFQQAGGLNPGAGQQYVSYSFNLASGDYKATYNILQNGPNPENSVAASPFYRTHFADRWINDELQLGSDGADILDRQKSRFAPDDCRRTEDTFANGVTPFPIGMFIANKVGPVRAIRAFAGANSGPLTQREHILYARRQDIRTSLRVHTIPGSVDFYDYSPAASGLTYRNDLNPAGVTIDGQPDALAAGPINWEQVSGAQGSVSIAHHITTDIPNFNYTSYYADTVTPANPQCTGDSMAYGASGVWINQEIPCTDQLPAVLGGSCPTSYRSLTTRRTLFYDAANQSAAVAAQHYAQSAQPLTWTVQPWGSTTPPPPGDSRTFPETGQTVSGRLLQYWNGNGALPVFGLPLDAQSQRTTPDGTFQAQLFERNRLELHPENARPYDVLLGRLGADALAKQGRPWETLPKETAKTGCRFFPQTGHNLCEPFLSYWQTHGLDLGQPGVTTDESLALFGLPISSVASERNSSGDTVPTQWFERARFEQHDENQPPYNVLLGRLGAELR